MMYYEIAGKFERIFKPKLTETEYNIFRLEIHNKDSEFTKIALLCKPSRYSVPKMLSWYFFSTLFIATCKIKMILL